MRTLPASSDAGAPALKAALPSTRAYLTSPETCSMSTMEAVNEDMGKFTLHDELQSKENNSCKNNYLQEKKTRSTPTSPNPFRMSSGRPRHLESPIIRLALFPRLEKCISEPEVWNDKGGGEKKDSEEKMENTCSGSKSDGHISHMSEDKAEGSKQSDEVQTDGGADDIEDVTEKRSMLSESHNTTQPPVIGLRHSPVPPCPGETLIMPRKLQNPCVDSREHQNLHRELLFNQKIGKNVLNQKSELQRALEKHKESQIKKELELQKQDNRTPLEKVIEERARRLESLEKSTIEEEPSSNKPEFLQVHAKLRARMDTK